MKILRAIWRELATFFGFHVPRHVSPDMPRSLEEHRERRRISEEQAKQNEHERNTK